MNLELAVLQTLVASPRAIPVSVIVGFVPGFTGKDETQGDVELAMKSLERKGHVKGTSHEDRGTLWKETADGRLRLA